MAVMEFITAKVSGGKVELPPEDFPEGSEVAVLRFDPGEPFELTADQVTELKESLEQVRRGEYVDGDALLEELRARTRR